MPDIARDLRFARNPVLRDKGLRFYAGAPLRDNHGRVLGTLCLLDSEPRTLNKREVGLLEAMAQELMDQLRDSVAEWGGLPTAPPLIEVSPPSSIVGQLLPS